MFECEGRCCRVLSASTDTTLRLWNIHSAECTATVSNGGRAVMCLAEMSEDGFATVSDQSTVSESAAGGF